MNGFTRVLLTAATLAAFGTQPAAAETRASPQAEAVVETKDQLVCQTAQVTGTRMPKRKCRTRDELRRAQEANRRKLDAIAREAMRAPDSQKP